MGTVTPIQQYWGLAQCSLVLPAIPMASDRQCVGCVSWVPEGSCLSLVLMVSGTCVDLGCPETFIFHKGAPPLSKPFPLV